MQVNASKRDGRWLQWAVATVIAATSAALGMGLLAHVTRYYWIQLSIWALVAVLLAGTAAAAAVRLWRDRDSLRARLRLQEDVTRALAHGEGVESQTAAILAALGSSLGFAVCVAWRADPNDGTLRSAGVWASDTVDAELFRIDTERVRFLKGQGVLGSVWASGQAVVVNDIAADPRLRRPAVMATLGLPSVMFVPIRQRGEVTGVIECFSAEPLERNGELLEQLERIGEQIGVAFDRALRSERLEESEERRRHVLAAMLRAEEDAKAKLAADLHDDTIQVLAATLLSLDRVAGAARAGDVARVAAAAGKARETLEQAVERTRLIMFDLRPRTLVEHGIGEAAKVLLEDAAADGELAWIVRTNIGRYNTSVENLVYRALQEAVANVRRHAHATRVTVDLEEHGGWLECTVQDDGRGFVVEEALDRNRMRLHLGLEAMRERIGTAGGELRLDSAPDRGTLVWFRVPLAAIADPDDTPADRGGTVEWRSESAD